jgi:hypothetical protein
VRVCFLHSSVSIDLLVISLWICYTNPCVLQVGRNDRHQCEYGSVGFLRISTGLPASFLQVSRGMLLGFPQVSCGFRWVSYCLTRFPAGFPWDASGCPAGCLPVSCGFPAGCLPVSCGFSVSLPWDACGFPACFLWVSIPKTYDFRGPSQGPY